MTRQPKRIQRKRTKGWRMPDRRHAVFVGRPTIWGNPFDWSKMPAAGALARKTVVEVYRHWLEHPECYPDVRKPPTTEQIKTLAGLDLVCWCPPDQPCHADVLIGIANAAQ